MPDDSTPARVAPVDARVATAPGEAAADMAEPSGHRHLDTDHLLPDIGRHAVSGGVFTAASQGVRFLLNLAAATVLARLLTPHDFGLVAMAGALMTILRAFRDGGLSTATVQRENITEAQVSNLFWINLVLGATITLLGAALAPGVAWFFQDERITPIAIWLSLAFVLNGAAVQHLALLNRQMRFRAVALIEITSATISFVVGVVLAWIGWGYWALVGMQLMASLMDLVLIWSACCTWGSASPWAPCSSASPGARTRFSSDASTVPRWWACTRGRRFCCFGRSTSS
jgi:PST family polysaccharide transporter